jgi:hypothetical protein
MKKLYYLYDADGDACGYTSSYADAQQAAFEEGLTVSESKPINDPDLYDKTPPPTVIQQRFRAYRVDTNFEGDFLDGMVKVHSTDPVLQAEGQAQLDKYYADCLAVKDRFPKE